MLQFLTKDSGGCQGYDFKIAIGRGERSLQTKEREGESLGLEDILRIRLMGMPVYGFERNSI